MLKTIAAGVVVLSQACAVLAGEPDTQKMREAIRLPRPIFGAGFRFDPDSGQLLPVGIEEPDLGPEIAELRKGLKGDISDAPRYFALGELYQRQGDWDKCKSAYERASELYSQQIKAKPEDGRARYNLACALAQTGNVEEAEPHLRKAIELNDRDWESWLELGAVLYRRGSVQMLGGPNAIEEKTRGKSGTEVEILAQLASTRQIGSEDAKRATKILDEAHACMDRAVRAAPDEPKTYTSRAASRVLRNDFQPILDGVNGFHVNRPIQLVYQAVVEDFQEASKRCPGDYRLIAGTIIWETTCYGSALKTPADLAKMPLIEHFTEQEQRSLTGALKRLENCTRCNDEKAAAAAFEALAWLDFMLRTDEKTAVERFKRALELDPTRAVAWSGLFALYIRTERYKEAIELGKSGLMNLDTAQRRLLLAKAYDYLNEFDQAEEHVRVALKQAPKNYLANLNMAAVLLKRAKDKESLAEVKKYLDRGGELMPSTAQAFEERDYKFLRGLYLAISGEHEGARALFQEVLKTDGEDQEAKDALRALAE